MKEEYGRVRFVLNRPGLAELGLSEVEVGAIGALLSLETFNLSCICGKEGGKARSTMATQLSLGCQKLETAWKMHRSAGSEEVVYELFARGMLAMVDDGGEGQVEWRESRLMINPENQPVVGLNNLRALWVFARRAPGDRETMAKGAGLTPKSLTGSLTRLKKDMYMEIFGKAKPEELRIEIGGVWLLLALLATGKFEFVAVGTGVKMGSR